MGAPVEVILADFLGRWFARLGRDRFPSMLALETDRRWRRRSTAASAPAHAASASGTVAYLEIFDLGTEGEYDWRVDRDGIPLAVQFHGTGVVFGGEHN